MNSIEALAVLDSLAATGSRVDKADILHKHIGDAMMQKVVRYAYDPFITFGVSAPDRALAKGGVLFDEHAAIWIVLDQLARRELTGGMATDLLKKIMSALSPQSGELLWRILSKDLRCGITEKTVNIVMPGLVPTFDVMLAKAYEPKRITTFPVAVEPKLDGNRLVCLVREGRARFFSRTGKPVPAVEHLEDAVLEMVRNAMKGLVSGTLGELAHTILDYFGGDINNPTIALDGEATGPGNFNEASGALRRKSEKATDSVYTIFDIVPFNEFTMDTADPWMPFQGRRNILDYVLRHNTSPNLKIIEQRLLNSHAEIDAMFREILDAGGEGVIVKPTTATYQKRKCFDWLKVKAEETEDLRVIGAYEGEQGTKLEGNLGGLVVERRNTKTGEIVYVCVGGGFKEEERDPLWNAWVQDARDADTNFWEFGKDFWRNQAHKPEHAVWIDKLRVYGAAGGRRLLGRIIEVEFHEVTPDGSLRHPRHLRFRDDKTVATDQEAA